MHNHLKSLAQIIIIHINDNTKLPTMSFPFGIGNAQPAEVAG